MNRNLRRGIALAWATSPRALVRYAVLGMFRSLLPPVMLFLGALFVNKIAAAAIHHRFDYRGISLLIGGIWIVSFAQRAIGAYIDYGKNLFVRNIQLEAEQRLLEQAARLDLGHFDNSDWHDRLSRAKRDVGWRPGDLTWSVLGLGGNIVTILIMASLLARLHYSLVILALVSAFVSILLAGRVTSGFYDFFFKEATAERERTYLGDLLIEPRASKEVRALVLGNYLLERHRKLARTLLLRREQKYKLGISSSVWTGLISSTASALAYGVVAIRGAAGLIDPGGFIMVIGAFTAVSQMLGQIATTFITVDQHSTFLDDYFSFLAIPALLPVAAEPQRLPDTDIFEIEFDNVSFSYPGGNGHAVTDLNLRIYSGELIALVGDNGAGKSTLIKLLLRFYDVDKGAIRVNGIDIRKLDPNDWRRRVGVLFQDFTNYELTIRENIAIGRADQECDDDQVWTALRNSRSDSLVNQMPRGLDCKVGRLFEGGHDLSGGEWQRLALARIMYRDAGVWILDEPASALDPQAEADIFGELKESLKGRIGIVISHRFSTVRGAHRVIVMADGRVAEVGAHEELLQAGGRYAELFALQAAGYR